MEAMQGHKESVQRALQASKQAAEKLEVGEDVNLAVTVALDCLATQDSSIASQDYIALAFDNLAKVLELRKGIYEFPRNQQEALAKIIYDYWTSSDYSYNCRSLLDLVLVGEQAGESSFIPSLLQVLRESFAIGNKRPLQILALIFDVTPRGLLDKQFPTLWDQLVLGLQEHAGALQAAKILVKLGREMRDLSERLLPLLVLDVQHARQAVYETLLPGLLGPNPALLLDLSNKLETSSVSQGRLQRLAYLSLLRAGATASVSAFPDLTTVEASISSSLTHTDPTIRFEALRLLSLLPVGNKPSQPIPSGHFALYRLFWKYNLTDSDSASVRTGLIGAWKEFIVRCKVSSSAASRDLAKSKKAEERGMPGPSSATSETATYLQEVKGFFEQWTEAALGQLKAYKPYRCQMNSLRFLEILLGEGIDANYKLGSITTASCKGKAAVKNNSSSRPFSINIVQRPEFIVRALGCITSTYEDIKSTAYALLTRCALSSAILEKVRQAALGLIGQQRDADIASGILLCRLFLVQQPSQENREEATLVALQTLLGSLSIRLAEASRDFEGASEGTPLHGYLSAIKSV